MQGVAEHRPYVDPNSVRMYPHDPLRELRRLRRRADRKSNGFGTFGQADVQLMVEVEADIGRKLKRLAFLEGKLKEMTA